MTNAVETGKFDPSLPSAFKAARLFKLPIENIFEDEQSSRLSLSGKTLAS
ncbi:MAG: hypothetical protein V7771_14750 [Shewanella psychromarinicola]